MFYLVCSAVNEAKCAIERLVSFLSTRTEAVRKNRTKNSRANRKSKSKFPNNYRRSKGSCFKFVK